ncbi:MAG: DedA family protein [Actinomycetota bacterium]
MISAGFDLVNSVVEYLETFASSPWFYLVIFVIAYFDSIIPAVPSETTVILGGIAAGRGELDILLVILMGAVGAYLGDTTTYTIGSRSGGLAARFLFRGEKGEENLRRTGEQIRKRGGLLLITARFIPGGRTAITFTCGLTGQPFWRWFTRWDLLAVFVWASYAGLLGFFFGDRFEDDHTAAFWWAFGTALSVTAVIEVVRFVRGRLRSPSAPVPDGDFVDDLVDGAVDRVVDEMTDDDGDDREAADAGS